MSLNHSHITPPGGALESLSRLEGWFSSICDGEREHFCGITIKSTDNPGWWLIANLDKISFNNVGVGLTCFNTVAEMSERIGSSIQCDEKIQIFGITSTLEVHVFAKLENASLNELIHKLCDCLLSDAAKGA